MSGAPPDLKWKNIDCVDRNIWWWFRQRIEKASQEEPVEGAAI